MEKELERYYQYLRENSYKITPKRKAVLNLLIKDRRYYSVQEIWKRLSNDFDKLGMPTIYRILQQFTEIRIANYVVLDDNCVFYYICDPGLGRHHHFICRRCKGVFCLDFCAADMIKDAALDQLGAEVTGHKLVVQGYCANCREKLQNESEAK